MSDILYNEVHSGNPDVVAFQFLDGKYKDVVVSIGKITMKEDVEEDRLKLAYEFEVLDDADFLETDDDELVILETNPEFKNFMHKFVEQLINDTIKKGG